MHTSLVKLTLDNSERRTLEQCLRQWIMKIIFRIFYLLLLIVIYFSVNPVYGQDFTKIDKVVIDAGHGGKDPGTMGKHVDEKDVALAIALKVGKLISDNLKDVKVIYTRKTDVFVELFRRAQIANKAKADLFISIHCNANKSTVAKGTETWVMGTHRSKKNLEVAKKENSAILLEANHNKNYDNFDPNSPESYITLSLLQGAYTEQSMSLAEAVQTQFRTRVHRVDRGVKEAGFLVLVYTAMPSILIETGFLSNPDDEKFLMSEKGKDYIASAIYRAFKNYKKSIEENSAITYADSSQDEKRNNLSKSTINNKKKKSSVKQTTQAVVKGSKANEKSKSPKKSADKKAVMNKVYFGVQFTTRSKKVNIAKNFKGISEVWYYSQNGHIKYVSGRYVDFKSAMHQMRKIRKGKYKDAFVVAFINGKRVSRAQAEAELKK